MQSRADSYPAGSDESYMQEALDLALRGIGWTSPNPLVGAVLVRDGTVIGRGWHARDGEKHAEVIALENAGDARGATCYVTLEPCTHLGRQPACSDLLAQAGVRRVVYGCDDTDDRTAGKAAPLLESRGIEVKGGCLRSQCERQLDYYLKCQRTQAAYFHLKLALSLDGKVACASGSSQWLSGPESLGYAHFLRQKYDAVLVGYRTVLKDNPRLTTRVETMAHYYAMPDELTRNPVRIILDPRFELAGGIDKLNIGKFDGAFRQPGLKLVIVGSATVLLPSLDADAPVFELALEPSSGLLDFHELKRELWALGIHSVLVEGGGGLAREALRQQAVDKLTLVYTPVLIGGDGIGFSPELGCASLQDCPRLVVPEAFVLGSDCLLEGYPTEI